MRSKNIILVLLLIFSTTTLFAQLTETYIGVRGGMNGGNITVQPFIPKKTNWGNYEGGIVFRRISGDKWVGGIQTELSYVQTSFKFLEKNESDSSYIRSMTSLELPFMWHPYYGFGKKQNFRVFLNAGAYLSYMINSKYEYIDNFDLTSTYNRSDKYAFNRHLDVRLGYGLMGGAGFEVMLTKHIQMNVEFRYKFSFSDIWKYKSKVDPALSAPTEAEKAQMFGVTDYSQSQVTQMGVSFGLMYRFGKKEKKIEKE